MRFITSIDGVKLDELIDNSKLLNNHVFDVNGDVKSLLSNLLNDLNGSFSSLVVGLVVPDNYGPLSSIWEKISKLLPIKSGDIIMQFNLNEDECLFCDFNDFTSSIYLNPGSLRDKIVYQPSPLCIVISDTIEAENFDYAYVVNSNWGKGEFNSSSNSKFITSILDLKVSNVWR